MTVMILMDYASYKQLAEGSQPTTSNAAMVSVNPHS